MPKERFLQQDLDALAWIRRKHFFKTKIIA